MNIPKTHMDRTITTTSRTVLRDCFCCDCRYAVERTVRILDSAQSKAKPSTGRIIDRCVYCQDCGEDLD